MLLLYVLGSDWEKMTPASCFEVDRQDGGHNMNMYTCTLWMPNSQGFI